MEENEAKKTEQLAYEQPDVERPASAAPTEEELERELPSVPKLDYSPAPPAHDPYAALRYPAYVQFSIGWMIAIIGNMITAVAIGWQVYELTASKLALGWVGGIQAIPLIFLALPGGAIADRFDRRRVVMCTAVGVALCSLGLASLPYTKESVLWMYGLLLLSASVLTLGRPARSALLPTIVPPSTFSNAVTWNSSTFQIAAMVGPALGGAIIAYSLKRYHNVRLAYLIDAACSLIFAVVLLLMSPPQFASPRKPRDGSEGILANLSAGIRFVWRTNIILATITLDLFAVLLGGAVYLLPVFSVDILKVGAGGLGMLRAAEALGAISMGLLIAHMPPMKRAGRAMLLAVAAFGAATIVFGLSRNFWLSFAALFLIGAFDNISVVVRHTLVQVLTPDAMRGRVSAVNNVFIGASNELGGLESGVTAQLFGPIVSVVGGGIGTILVVLSIAAIWPQVRKFGSLHEAVHATAEADTAEASAAS
jgi:MFS family permease